MAEVTLLKYSFESGLSHYVSQCAFNSELHGRAKTLLEKWQETVKEQKTTPAFVAFMERVEPSFFTVVLPEAIVAAYQETYPNGSGVTRVVVSGGMEHVDAFVRAARECVWAVEDAVCARRAEMEVMTAAVDAAQAAGRAYNWRVVSSLAPLRYVA